MVSVTCERKVVVFEQKIPPNVPPVLYVPCAEHVQSPTDAVVDMRETKDGRLALLACTALDRLHDCCGIRQPWVLLTVPMLNQLHQARPYDLLLLDIEIPHAKRRLLA